MGHGFPVDVTNIAVERGKFTMFRFVTPHRVNQMPVSTVSPPVKDEKAEDQDVVSRCRRLRVEMEADGVFTPRLQANVASGFTMLRQG
jgi:hypothetical protein